MLFEKQVHLQNDVGSKECIESQRISIMVLTNNVKRNKGYAKKLKDEHQDPK